MENLFKTNNAGTVNSQPTQVQNPQEFNTMQNLFSTQANVGSMNNEGQAMQSSSGFGKKSQPLEEDLL